MCHHIRWHSGFLRRCMSLATVAIAWALEPGAIPATLHKTCHCWAYRHTLGTILSTLSVCGQHNNGPKDAHIISRTCEYVRVHDKGELRLQVEWRLLISRLQHVRFPSVYPASLEGSFSYAEEEESQTEGIRRCCIAGSAKERAKSQGITALSRRHERQGNDSP